MAQFKATASSNLEQGFPNHFMRFISGVCLDESRLVYLRNEFNIFSVDRGFKRRENCINARSALLQKFSVLFSVDISINRKNIRFISYHLIFISFQQRNRSRSF